MLADNFQLHCNMSGPHRDVDMKLVYGVSATLQREAPIVKSLFFHIAMCHVAREFHLLPCHGVSRRHRDLNCILWKLPLCHLATCDVYVATCYEFFNFSYFTVPCSVSISNSLI